ACERAWTAAVPRSRRGTACTRPCGAVPQQVGACATGDRMAHRARPRVGSGVRPGAVGPVSAVAPAVAVRGRTTLLGSAVPQDGQRVDGAPLKSSPQKQAAVQVMT